MQEKISRKHEHGGPHPLMFTQDVCMATSGVSTDCLSCTSCLWATMRTLITRFAVRWSAWHGMGSGSRLGWQRYAGRRGC